MAGLTSSLRSTAMDLEALSDQEIGALSREITIEQDRRRTLKVNPPRITELRDQYIAAGGNFADLGYVSVG